MRPNLGPIAEPLRHQTVCGARIRVIGADELSLPGVQIDHIPWHEDTEAMELAACHVGIAPLANGPWEKGKCGYKIIQYMAAGRPVVGSSVGAHSSIIVAGKTGFFADSFEQWISTLSGLAADRERNQKMGLAARERAEAMYSLQCNTTTLIEVFQFACGSTELEGAARTNQARRSSRARFPQPSTLTPAE